MKKIDEQKKRIFARDQWRCRRCGRKDDLQRAHLIAQRKDYAKMIVRLWRELFQEDITEKQAWEIINSDVNIVTSCSKCNSRFNKGGDPEYVKRFLKFIKKNVDN